MLVSGRQAGTGQQNDAPFLCMYLYMYMYTYMHVVSEHEARNPTCVHTQLNQLVDGADVLNCELVMC